MTDLLAQAVLLVMLVAAPWFVGGERQEAWFAAAVLAALLGLAISLVRRRFAAVPVPIAIVPLLAALGLGVVQLIPLDPGAVAVLSPAAARLRDEFQRPVSSTDASLAARDGAVAPDRQPLSLDPASTRRDLSMLTVAAAAFFLGATLFHTAEAQLWLCGLLAINGAAIAVFGLIGRLVQRLTHHRSLYFVLPSDWKAHPFDPYVNPNNAAGYLTLCMAAAIGTLIWAIGRRRTVPLAVNGFPSPRRPTWTARLKRSALEFLARLDGVQIAAFALATCVAMGIVCALSRGAWIATAGALVVTGTATLVTRRRFGPAAVLGFVAAAGIGLAIWAGSGGSIGHRLAVLFDAAQGPLPHWRESSRAVPDFWRLGSGLGTYGYVYGQYEVRPRQVWYRHAENEPLQTLVEAGIPGLMLLAAMAAIVAWSTWYVVCRESDPGTIAFGIVALFAVTAQIVHAFFDFGLHIPANMLTFAVLCGAVAGRAVQLAPRSRASAWPALPRLAPLPLAVAIAFAVACGWGFFELHRANAIQTALDTAEQRDPETGESHRFDETRPSGGSAIDLRSAIERIEAALRNRPDDAEGHSRAGVLWTHLYHVHTYETLQRAAKDDSVKLDIWERASLTFLHLCACRDAAAGQPLALEQLRSQSAVIADLRPAQAHFLLARRYCPLIAEPHLGLGALLPLDGDFVGDAIEVERARRLEPTNPKLLFQSGLLDFQASRLETGYAAWKKCLTLNNKFMQTVLVAIGTNLADVEIVRKLLPDAPDLLVRLTRKELVSAGWEQARSALSQRALELLPTSDLPDDEKCYFGALAFENRKEYGEAIKCFDQAVRLRPRDVDWREQYARLLESQGQLSGAIDQVRLLAMMEPENRRIQTWLMNLHLASLRQGAKKG